MVEMWDLYDKNRNPLGKLHERGKPLNKGEFHIVVDIISINKEGKILVTKRHPNKHFGNSWEVTGGSVIAGEVSIIGAVRELAEETGLVVEENELDYRGQILSNRSGCIHEFYVYKGDFSEKDIVLQEGETTDFKLVTPEEFLLMKNSGELLEFVYNRTIAVAPETAVQKRKPIYRIHHVSLKAQSREKLDEAVAFYCDILGLSVYRQWDNGVLIDIGGSFIEIFTSDIKFESGIIKHFALETDDVDKCVESVREKGYRVLIEPNNREIPSAPPVKLRMAFVEGALGEEIEFFKTL